MATFLPQVAYAFLILGGIILADPFKLSPINGIGFNPSHYPLLSPPMKNPPSDPHDSLSSSKIVFKNDFFGPESLLFDSSGEGPYTGLSNGLVVKWTGEKWITFAITSPNRTDSCNTDNPVPNLGLEHICGRPLGLQFHPTSGDLYIADAYFGLFVVGKEGGQAHLLASEADGEPFGFTNGLDILEDGTVFFTDSSTKYQRRQFLLEILEGQAYGRLLKFDPSTNTTTVLLRDLYFPNGVALSKDRSFLLICETSLIRVLRYWLNGPKAGSLEVFAELPGWPDNVKINPRGRFWVAVHARRNSFCDFALKHPWLRTAILSLPLNIKLIYAVLIRLPHGVAIELDEHGTVTQILEDKSGKVVKVISEIEEHDGKLWFGSVLMPHMAVYDL